MKKSLIALAVAGAFIAPVAMADTTIYGAANVSLDFVNSGSGGGSATQVSSGASAIGFKGSEDLGGGTSAIWQIETAISLDKGGDTWATNPTFAGLSGKDWGTVALGSLAGPYKTATRGYDLFADTIADNRSIMGPLDGSNRGTLANAIAYMSPSMSGFSVIAAYVAGAEIPMSGGTKGDAWSLAGMYGAGPINASLAYQTLTIGTAGSGTLGADLVGGGPNDKLDAYTLAGGYTMDAFAVNAQYEHRKYSPNGGGDQSQNDWYLAGKYNVTSNDAAKLAYSNAGNFGNQSDSGAKQWSVGYDHNLSKNTMVYALYTQISNDNNAAYGMGGYDGITGKVGAASLGAKVDAFSLGMKHNF